MALIVAKNSRRRGLDHGQTRRALGLKMLKKILYVNLTAKTSGAEFCLLRLMAGLDKKKFRPILLLPESGPLLDQAGRMDIETIVLPSLIKFGEHFHFWKVFKALRAVWLLKKIMQNKKINLLHANAPRASYISGPAAWLGKIPLVTHVRDIACSPFASRFKSRFIGFFSDRIVPVSQAVANFILKVNPTLSPKTEVIYDGFDRSAIAATIRADIRREWGLSPAARLIGSVGIIHPSKGQDILIRAAARLKESIPALKLLLIGEVFRPDAEAYRIGLEKLARELGIGGDVIFTGFRLDALNLVLDLDVFVHPAVIADSLPGALIEASALGKAIVATRVGGVAEIVEHERSALLVEPDRVDSLAAAILSLLLDGEKAKKMSRQARQRALSLFAIEDHVQSVSRIYEQLLAGKK
jgi:glycosyltransferase involved in cell wall biosynthesis